MIKLTLKIALAAGILYWLISQGKLDFGLISTALKNPQYFILGIILISLQILNGAYRLGYLLRVRSSKFHGKDLISIQWIVQMFSVVLPGAFTSDLLKIGYLKKQDERLSHKFIIFIILFDRMIGLSSLLFISGFFSLIFFKKLTNLNPAMDKIVVINILLFAISLMGMSLIFINRRLQNIFLKFIPTEKLKHLFFEIWELQQHRKTFSLAYLTSIIGHLLSVLAFWMVNYPFLGPEVSLDYLATLIPLGQLAVVIPISPGGIGVGHAAFSTLFSFIGYSNGASLYNVYWIMLLIVSLFGLFPFILRKYKA